MKPFNVLALVGGISSASINKSLYHEMVRHNRNNLVFELFDIASLPFFTQDNEYDAPRAVTVLKKKVVAADGILLITPEYNRSIPGVLKNALDWGSRPYGQNCWDDKPAAIMGASIGAIGTFGAQQHLRNICSFLNMHVMSQPEFYFNASAGMNESGLTDDSVKFLLRFLDAFETWIGRF